MTHPIAIAARGWIGTRFHHQGRLKKSEGHRGGVDCLGLLVGVAAELGLASKSGVALAVLDRRDYGHLPDTARLKAALVLHLHEITFAEARPGDIALLAIDGNAQHLGILSSYARGGAGIIHAYAPARAVVEHRLDTSWQSRVVAVFRV